MTPDRLARQMQFIVEIDKVKTILRNTWLMDGSRHENDAEHSWHLAVMALLLGEYANEKGIDLLRVVSMVLIHHVVEIDAGDILVYALNSPEARQAKVQRERDAADRIFGLLPDNQAAHFRGLWDEFEERQTPEARFAAALDRVQPMMHNYFTQGRAWLEHGVSADQVIAINRHVEQGAETLWEYASDLIRTAVEKGYLLPAREA